ncbi:MAG: hypothetical protein ACHRXM_14625 [Isosphaerales bacterium]
MRIRTTRSAKVAGRDASPYRRGDKRGVVLEMGGEPVLTLIPDFPINFKAILQGNVQVNNAEPIDRFVAEEFGLTPRSIYPTMPGRDWAVLHLSSLLRV